MEDADAHSKQGGGNGASHSDEGLVSEIVRATTHSPIPIVLVQQKSDQIETSITVSTVSTKDESASVENDGTISGCPTDERDDLLDKYAVGDSGDSRLDCPTDEFAYDSSVVMSSISNTYEGTVMVESRALFCGLRHCPTDEREYYTTMSGKIDFDASTMDSSTRSSDFLGEAERTWDGSTKKKETAPFLFMACGGRVPSSLDDGSLVVDYESDADLIGELLQEIVESMRKPPASLEKQYMSAMASERVDMNRFDEKELRGGSENIPRMPYSTTDNMPQSAATVALSPPIENQSIIEVAVDPSDHLIDPFAPTSQPTNTPRADEINSELEIKIQEEEQARIREVREQAEKQRQKKIRAIQTFLGNLSFHCKSGDSKHFKGEVQEEGGVEITLAEDRDEQVAMVQVDSSRNDSDRESSDGDQPTLWHSLSAYFTRDDYIGLLDDLCFIELQRSTCSAATMAIVSAKPIHEFGASDVVLCMYFMYKAIQNGSKSHKAPTQPFGDAYRDDEQSPDRENLSTSIEGGERTVRNAVPALSTPGDEGHTDHNNGEADRQLSGDENPTTDVEAADESKTTLVNIKKYEDDESLFDVKATNEASRNAQQDNDQISKDKGSEKFAERGEDISTSPKETAFPVFGSSCLLTSRELQLSKLPAVMIPDTFTEDVLQRLLSRTQEIADSWNRGIENARALVRSGTSKISDAYHLVVLETGKMAVAVNMQLLELIKRYPAADGSRENPLVILVPVTNRIEGAAKEASKTTNIEENVDAETTESSTRDRTWTCFSFEELMNSFDGSCSSPVEPIPRRCPSILAVSEKESANQDIHVVVPSYDTKALAFKVFGPVRFEPVFQLDKGTMVPIAFVLRQYALLCKPRALISFASEPREVTTGDTSNVVNAAEPKTEVSDDDLGEVIDQQRPQKQSGATLRLKEANITEEDKFLVRRQPSVPSDPLSTEKIVPLDEGTSRASDCSLVALADAWENVNFCFMPNRQSEP